MRKQSSRFELVFISALTILALLNGCSISASVAVPSTSEPVRPSAVMLPGEAPNLPLAMPAIAAPEPQLDPLPGADSNGSVEP